MIQETLNMESVAPNAVVRYVGVNVRPHSFGFVIVEGKTALDCGVRVCGRAQFDDCLGQRFQRIVQTYAPSSVIILASRAANKKRDAITNAITKAAKRGNVFVVRVGVAALRRYFRQYNASTKYEIAQSVARILPELSWRLPPRRKPWQAEHYCMSIFEAAAAVSAHAML